MILRPIQSCIKIHIFLIQIPKLYHHLDNFARKEFRRFFCLCNIVSPAAKLVSSTTISADLNHQIVSLLQKCKHLTHLKQVQSFVLTIGHGQTPFFAFKLLRFCTITTQNINYARFIFDHLDSPNVYLWTAMITAYAQQNDTCNSKSAIVMFTHMLVQGTQPNHFTFPYVLRACGDISAIEECKQIHTHILKLGFGGYTINQTALLDSYSKCSDLDTAQQLFDEMAEPNVVSWTAMISGCTRLGKIGAAISLFEGMPERDVPSWNAIIAGCTQNGFFSEAISLFCRMLLVENQRPNQITVVCALSACGHLGTLQLGNWIHCYIHKKGFEPNSCIVGNALVDMYGKCGSLKEARQVFDEIPERSTTLWNSVINSFALHGHCGDAIVMFKEMETAGIEPDEITFVGLLNACTHGGLVDEGCKYFESMSRDYGIEPRIEHYGCVIDLLGRAGRFGEALEIIRNMRIRADEVVWGSLLNSCRIHGNVELAECCVRGLLEIDPKNAAYCVVLANIYCECGRWKDVGRMRMMMKVRGVQKTPGCSWIEVNNLVNTFFSADKLHFSSEEIYWVLDGLARLLKDDVGFCF